MKILYKTRRYMRKNGFLCTMLDRVLHAENKFFIYCAKTIEKYEEFG